MDFERPTGYFVKLTAFSTYFPVRRDFFESRRDRNQFYTRVGYLVPPGETGMAQLKQLDSAMPPAEILSQLGD